MGRVKYRKETKQMGCIIYWNSVNAQHIVRVVTTLYVQTRIIF